MTKVVVIKFKNGGKLYYFSPRPGDVYERNMPVVVETARGLEFAWVAYPEREVEDPEIHRENREPARQRFLRFL